VKPGREAGGSGHFRAYSFIDRIASLEPGKRGKARYLVPAHVPRFSSCLGIEAAGQLAAWVAMAALDFRRRPVAGVAADVRFGVPVRPGGTLDLTAEIHKYDAEAVDFSAWAHFDGDLVVEIGHSVGPMLPSEEFDSVDAVRERFALITSPSGAPAGGFGGVPEHDLETVELVPGERIRSLLRVPREAAFFADHFPHRAVFPGTLLLDAQIQVSLQAAAGASHWPAGARLMATSVPEMKLRAFIAPGDEIELRSELSNPDGGGTMPARTSVYSSGKRIAMGGLQIEAVRINALQMEPGSGGQ
jgi:3-hydroxymyristoyl/3-hydroxydecanoyl-(acyl carrier protein) dehydratase